MPGGYDMEALLEEATRARDALEQALAEGTTTEAPAPSGGAPAENSTIKAIRAEAKRAEKRAAEAEAELAELRAFRETTVLAQRESALAAAGLTPAQVKVYLKAYDEVSPELVEEFKREVLGVREEPEEAITAGPFAPTGFVGEPAEKKLSVKDFNAMMRSSNPAERAKADQLAREGKVAFKNN